MNGWERIPLGDLYEVHNGLSKGSKFFGHGYPFLSFSTVFNNFFVPKTLSDLVQSTDAERDNYSILRGDVFITRTSETSDELGMSCVALKDYPNATYNGFTKRMRPKTDKVLPEYIGYYLRMPSFRSGFQAFSAMSTRASLRNEDLLGMVVKLPSIHIQTKIASILLAYDNLIENYHNQIKLLEETAQRLYKEWFVDLRFPEYEHTKVVDGLPEGWRKGSLGSFFPISIGKTPPRSEHQWFSNNVTDIPWVSISDMGNSSIFIKETSERLTKEAVERFNIKIVPSNTIFVSFKLTVGRVSISTEPMCTNEAIAHVQIKEAFFREYVYLYLKNFKYDTLGNTSSISQAINSKVIKAMPAIIPDNTLLKRFNKILAPIFDEIYNKNLCNLKLREARDRLLPKLMNGEIEL